MARDNERTETEWQRPELSGDGVIDIDKVSAESDTSSDTRKLVGRWASLFSVVAVISSLFHFYTAGYRPLPALEQRPIHIAFMLFLCFLVYPMRRGKPAGPPPTTQARLPSDSIVFSRRCVLNTRTPSRERSWVRWRGSIIFKIIPNSLRTMRPF